MEIIVREDGRGPGLLVEPLRHLPRVVDTVERLNQIGESRLGVACATFTGSGSYLAIEWNGILLWDTEGTHREDRSFGDDKGFEPTLELCCKILSEEGMEIAVAFEDCGRGMDDEENSDDDGHTDLHSCPDGL